MATTQHRCRYQDSRHELWHQQSPTRQNRKKQNQQKQDHQKQGQQKQVQKRRHQKTRSLRQSSVNSSGFTLIELMICLSLIATLSAMLAPRLLETMPALVLERQTQQLQSLLSNARTLAMVHDSSTIVCPASTASLRPLNAENPLAGGWCDPHGDWQAGVNVVLDRDQNRSIDAADALVFHLAWYTSQGLPPRIQWRGFRDDDQIEFLASGMTNWQNGRFIFCSPTHQIPAKHLVINAAGRSYVQEVSTQDCG